MPLLTGWAAAGFLRHHLFLEGRMPSHPLDAVTDCFLDLLPLPSSQAAVEAAVPVDMAGHLHAAHILSASFPLQVTSSPQCNANVL